MKLKTEWVGSVTVGGQFQMLADIYNCHPIAFGTEPLLMGTGTTKSATVRKALTNRKAGKQV